jgi:thioredoxin:protein disulfide reductase
VTRVVVLLLTSLLGMAQGGTRGVTADITPLVETAEVRAGETARVALRVVLPPNLHVQSNTPRDKTLIPTALAIDPIGAVRPIEVVFPRATDFAQEGSSEPLSVFESTFALGARLEIDPAAPPGEIRVPGRLRYQACDDRVCFMPVTVGVEWVLRVSASPAPSAPQHSDVFGQIAFGTGAPPPAIASLPAPASRPSAAVKGGVIALLDQFEIRDDEGGYLNKSEFLEFVRRAESGTPKKGLFDGRGPIAILAIVFLGGLALNLTPCVLPMIPINLAIIGAGTRAGHRGRGFALGATYGAAMAVVYGVLGLVVILTTGTFGTINASPWFNAGIAVLFVVLGLAMFDVIHIDFSRWSGRFQVSEASRGTFLLAFGMGAIAALLAGACVAPVVIQVVVFAGQLHASGNATALALPFVLGLGMALPWPIAGAGFAALPKPGAWMVKVKYALGVFILATAAYYGYLAYTLLANRWVDPAAVSASVAEKLKAGWHESLADGLAKAQRDGTPVLVDLWATWCKNCLTMDKTTLADPEVIAAISGYTRIKFQAEDPDSSPAREVMQKLGAVGLPTYVILRRK